MDDLSFFCKKKILVTGHTGFKGSWLCKLLLLAGAEVTGIALEPPTCPALFGLCNLKEHMHSVIGDVRDLEHMKKVFREVQPEIVIHMAAQPIVRNSYENPVYTYEVNVMGTVNILECARMTKSVKSFLNVTTDKVYLNKEWNWGYREYEELNGYDPYSNSKSCSELVTDSYRKSFFLDQNVAISTARAGNVIGGGDFAKDRIIPDCIRAAMNQRSITVRNPFSTRPYQHVLEPLMAYLIIVKEQYLNRSEYEGSYNVGPDETNCWTTGSLVSLFCDKWKEATGNSITWKNEYDGGPHEANFLKLDCSKLKAKFGWSPRWNVETSMDKIVEWSVAYMNGYNVTECMDKQIREFIF